MVYDSPKRTTTSTDVCCSAHLYLLYATSSLLIRQLVLQCALMSTSALFVIAQKVHMVSGPQPTVPGNDAPMKTAVKLPIDIFMPRPLATTRKHLIKQVCDGQSCFASLTLISPAALLLTQCTTYSSGSSRSILITSWVSILLQNGRTLRFILSLIVFLTPFQVMIAKASKGSKSSSRRQPPLLFLCPRLGLIVWLWTSTQMLWSSFASKLGAPFLQIKESQKKWS